MKKTPLIKWTAQMIVLGAAAVFGYTINEHVAIALSTALVAIGAAVAEHFLERGDDAAKDE